MQRRAPFPGAKIRKGAANFLLLPILVGSSANPYLNTGAGAVQAATNSTVVAIALPKPGSGQTSFLHAQATSAPAFPSSQGSVPIWPARRTDRSQGRLTYQMLRAAKWVRETPAY